MYETDSDPNEGEGKKISYMPFSGLPHGPRLDDWILNGEWNEHIIKSEKYIDFIPRHNFEFDRSLTWYPAHMTRGVLQMNQKIDTIDCILEVRDARAPLSSSNPNIYANFPSKIPRLVVLNKSDLVPKKDLSRTLKLFEKANLKAISTNAIENRKINRIVDFCKNDCNVKFTSIGIAMLLVGLPNVGKSSLITSMKKYAQNVAKYSDRSNKIIEGVKRTKPYSSHLPGTSKHLNMFQIASNPKIYCFDTPGIMLPKSDDLELNLKLASLGAVEEKHQDLLYIADYALYWLNKYQHFAYVEQFHMSSPTNSIRHVISAAHKIANINKKDVFIGDETEGAKMFLKLFRNGALGKFVMDVLYDPELIIKRSELDNIGALGAHGVYFALKRFRVNSGREGNVIADNSR